VFRAGRLGVKGVFRAGSVSGVNWVFRAGRVSGVKRGVQTRELGIKGVFRAGSASGVKGGVQSWKGFWSKRGCLEQ